MGIGGSIIGCATLMYFTGGERVVPISPLGFVVATGGAFILLFFYRLLGGRYFVEGERGTTAARAPYFSFGRRPRRASYSSRIDD